MFTLKLRTSGAAFEDENMPHKWATGHEVRRILYRTVEDIANGKEHGLCIDLNGNIVGEWDLILD